MKTKMTTTRKAKLQIRSPLFQDQWAHPPHGKCYFQDNRLSQDTRDDYAHAHLLTSRRSPYARQQSGGASSTTPNPRFAPISASGYFDAANQVSVSSRGLESRVYYTPPKYAGRNGTVIFCHHGAGYSGLSFACFAQEVKDLSAGNCGVMSLDARRHGECLLLPSILGVLD